MYANNEYKWIITSIALHIALNIYLKATSEYSISTVIEYHHGRTFKHKTVTLHA